MIIAITDGKGMTDKVSTYISDGQFDQAKNLYSVFFKKHYEVLNSSDINWEISKTTGDGVLFYTKNEDYPKCLESLVNLHKELNSTTVNEVKIKSRLFSFYCKDCDVINGDSDKYFNVNIQSFTKKDLFGHMINYGFRLLSLASGAVIFTEEGFMSKLLGDNVLNSGIDPNKKFKNINFSKKIPITFLKGINECGFRFEKKNPKWIWEIFYK
jgi:hypothetical protein